MKAYAAIGAPIGHRRFTVELEGALGFCYRCQCGQRAGSRAKLAAHLDLARMLGDGNGRS